MKENKNELMLWVGIMAIIGIFIYFMPDIERFVFGQAKKDKEAGTTEEVKKEEPKKEIKVTIPSSYECSLDKTESFYKQSSDYKYTFDKNGNTLTALESMTMIADNADGYKQLKAIYEDNNELANKLGEEFNNYYSSKTEYDDTNRTVKLSVEVKDYQNAIKMINKYNKEHTDATISLNIYATYNETEINMKSEGYTCK